MSKIQVYSGGGGGGGNNFRHLSSCGTIIKAVILDNIKDRFLPVNLKAREVFIDRDTINETMSKSAKSSRDPVSI